MQLRATKNKIVRGDVPKSSSLSTRKDANACLLAYCGVFSGVVLRQSALTLESRGRVRDDALEHG